MAKEIRGSDGRIYVEKRKPNFLVGCLVTFILFIFFSVVGIFITIFMTGKLNQNIQKEISGVSDKSEYITMDEFSQIKTGMTYEEVKKIVGSSGKVSSEVSSGKYKIVIITWYGNGAAGSNANVTFQNGKVQGKAQAGLK